MPWRRMASRPVTKPSTPDAAVPARMASSGGRPHTFAACAETYPAVPRNMAWPKDSRPLKPTSRLKAHANSAKHIAFIRNTGYKSSGATAKKATIAAKAIFWCFGIRRPASLLRSEEPGGLHHEHERHDDEDDGVRRLRIEDLGEALRDPEREA